MKKKDYLKLVTDVTTLDAKVKLFQKQIPALITSCEEHFATAHAQFGGIQATLQDMEKASAAEHEHSSTTTVQKRNLHSIERDLKMNVETVLKHQFKQLQLLIEQSQKFTETLVSSSDDKEFDVTSIREQLDKSKAIILSIAKDLNTLQEKFNAIHMEIVKFTQICETLMMDHALEDTMQKTSTLTRIVSEISHHIEETPDLEVKYVKQLTPLKAALAALTDQTKLLSIAHSPVKDESKERAEESKEKAEEPCTSSVPQLSV